MAVCTTTLPDANADKCTYNIHFGRIDMIMFTRLGDDLTDVSSSSEWGTRVDNTTALPSPGTDAPIRYMYGVGSLPLPERTEVTISLGRKTYTASKHTLTFNVDDTGSVNATFLNEIQETPQTYALWFVADGQLYGGNAGIEASVTANGRLIPESNEEIQTINIIASFEGALPVPITAPASVLALVE